MDITNPVGRIAMTPTVCGECGIYFTVPCIWFQGKQEDHTDFYCPNGHKRYFPRKKKENKPK